MRPFRAFRDMAAAIQFLTRIPLPWLAYDPNALSRSAKYFPLVGGLLGLAAGSLFLFLSAHLPVTLAALVTVLFTVMATGALHEDGLADVADAFGGGWSREQVLTILKDSRIGSYGALAIVFSIAARTALLAALPTARVLPYGIAAHVLSRWTVLPLGCMLPAARKEASQGARLARQISVASVSIATAAVVAIAAYLLRMAAWAPMLAVLVTTSASGFYFRRRIGGVTGDCFGAVIQLAEIAVYFTGVWRA